MINAMFKKVYSGKIMVKRYLNDWSDNPEKVELTFPEGTKIVPKVETK